MVLCRKLSFSNLIKRLDQYGNPIGIRFNNQSKHKTTIGGVLSILSVLWILCYFSILLNGVLNFNNVVIQKQSYVSPSSNQSYDLDPTTFDFAFSLSFNDNLAH
jgi:hypothetical protein